MITPIDICCMQIIEAEKRPDKVHYHLTNPPLPHPRSPLEEATFHLVERNVAYNQIGFDYYANLVTYRI